MSLSLFAASALNASAAPVSFSPIAAPDYWSCDNFYSHPSPPVISDCRIAFNQLPRGDCEIHFHLSGQSSDTVEGVVIIPTDIRTMAAWVLGYCGSTGQGGMVTKGLKKTINAMNDASSKAFPDPPLPPSSTFYSLFIWKPNHGSDENWNAGNNDPGVGAAISEVLRAAIRAAARGSPAYKELERRYEWLDPRVSAMEYDPASHWWDGPSHRDSSVSTS